MTEAIRTGGCLCGSVRYSVRGDHYKSGLCHCTDCRQVTGSAFLAYADWRPERFEYTGQIATYRGRSFCPTCGSRLFSLNDHQAEIYLGTLDEAPNGVAPVAEGWVKRREHWLPPLSGIPQYQEDLR